MYVHYYNDQIFVGYKIVVALQHMHLHVHKQPYNVQDHDQYQD